MIDDELIFGSDFFDLEEELAPTSDKLHLREGELREVTCLLYTSDAADDLLCVDLGGRRIIKNKIK